MDVNFQDSVWLYLVARRRMIWISWPWRVTCSVAQLLVSMGSMWISTWILAWISTQRSNCVWNQYGQFLRLMSVSLQWHLSGLTYSTLCISCCFLSKGSPEYWYLCWSCTRESLSCRVEKGGDYRLLTIDILTDYWPLLEVDRDELNGWSMPSTFLLFRKHNLQWT